ncbi:AAA family ATPase [Nonomuraea dietziae]|uniref:AAA family ATPase n=1 Tax=Nonomuraea dietziae TaxID=65515 RepID=UPI0033E344B5
MTFVAPPWPEIFENGAERRQTLEEASLTYDRVREAYLDYGYSLVELPRLAVRERVGFVLRHLRRA